MLLIDYMWLHTQYNTYRLIYTQPYITYNNLHNTYVHIYIYTYKLNILKSKPETAAAN